MGERTFDIVFDGSIINGADPLDVKGKVSKLFKLDATSADRLFSGSPIKIKQNVDRKTAMQYQSAMNQAGARVQLVIHRSSEQSAPPGNHSATVNKEHETTKGSEWTLAEVGSQLGSPKSPVDSSHIKTSHIELEKVNPFLQEAIAAGGSTESTYNPSYPDHQVEAAPDYDISTNEDIEKHIADRLKEVESLIAHANIEADASFDLAAAGTELLDQTERQEYDEIDLDLSHLSLQQSS